MYGLDADDIKSLSVDGQDMQNKAIYDKNVKVTDN